jgi:hypothetical protein
MSRYVVDVISDSPHYWSVLFNDGSTERLQASSWSAAEEEADQRFGVSQTQQIELEEEFD